MEQASDPNQNSQGISAAEAALSAADDQQLRIPYYCEENVWRLAYRKTNHFSQERYFVCFISNENKTVAMYNQLAGTSPVDDNQPVCWDYHVILICYSSRSDQVTVHDLDSRLSYPCPLQVYLRESFSSNNKAFAPPFAPRFRLIPADLFLQYFSSDRMHMYNVKTQSWNAAPPPYNCIDSLACDDNASLHVANINLQRYLDFRSDQAKEEHASSSFVPKEALGWMLALDELSAYNFKQAA